MRLGITLPLLGGLLTGAVDAQASDINIMCRGRAETIEYGDTDIMTGQDDVAKVMITGAGATAALPRLIAGRNHQALKIKDLWISEAQIKGEIWYGKIGNAKMIIDRVTGLISVRGPRGNFSGTCAPFDPAAPPKPIF